MCKRDLTEMWKALWREGPAGVRGPFPGQSLHGDGVLDSHMTDYLLGPVTLPFPDDGRRSKSQKTK